MSTRIIGTLYSDEIECKDAPLAHHLAGLSYTATGYGRKIPTTRMVRLPGSKRWRRVYAAVFGNNPTCYVTRGADWIVIR